MTDIQLYNDIIDFVMLLRAGGNAVPSNSKHDLGCLVQLGSDVLPRLCNAYSLLFMIGFSHASCERLFPKLKLKRQFLSVDVKNEVVQTGA